jgi:2-iminobutanoate/2-iminopropanoate deaminase
MRKAIATQDAPEAFGPYAQGYFTDSMVFTSGQLGIDVKTGKLAVGIEAQAHAAMKNLGAILKAANAGYGDIVKTTVFLRDLADFAVVNKIYEDYFEKGAYPARSCVQVAKLPLDGLVEIECIASRQGSGI